MVPDHDKQVVGSFVALLAPSLYSGFKRDKLIKFISLIYFSPQKKKEKKNQNFYSEKPVPKYTSKIFARD